MNNKQLRIILVTFVLVLVVVVGNYMYKPHRQNTDSANAIQANSIGQGLIELEKKREERNK